MIRTLIALFFLAAPAARAAADPSSPCSPTGSPPAYIMGTTDIEGIHYGGVPSEPCIAVGPAHIFCIGPGDVRIYDKATGAMLRSQCQNVFFKTSTGCLSGADPEFGDGGGLIDPDAYFDRVNQRFVAVSFSVLGLGAGHVQSHLHLAVSATPDPMGPWHVYHMTTTRLKNFPTRTFLPDRPSVGGSLDKICIASHAVSYDGGPELTLFRTVNADSAYNNLVPDPLHPDSIAYYDHLNYDTLAFNTRIGNNATADPVIHTLSVGGPKRYRAIYRAITGPAAQSVLTDSTGYSFRYRVTYGRGTRAPQLGTPIKVINTLDTMPNPSRLWVRNGVLSVAWHQYAVPCPPDTTNVIHVLRVKVNNPGGPASLTALMDTTYGDPPAWYAFPAICDDSLGRIYLGFQASSAAMYPSAFVTGMKPDDATIEVNPTLAKAGTKYWTRADGSGNVGRWGDFSCIDLDESVFPPVAYYVGEWGKPGTTSTFDSLGTWIRSFYFAAPTASVPGATPAVRPGNLSIEGLWPNPTRGELRIQIGLQRAARVDVVIAEVSGRRVRVISNGTLPAGSHTFVWDGRDTSGRASATGIYLCRASDGQASQERKFTLLR